MRKLERVDDFRSWGRVLKASHKVAKPSWRDELPEYLQIVRQQELSLIPAGLCRSYGDTMLNPDGAIFRMDGLNKLIQFDPETRMLRAEAGATFDALIPIILKQGFFLPVTPGTRFVTLGGAVANDVHGKNHHRNGTIGSWVRKIGLMKSDGQEITLDESDETGLFNATIGGLGLTGLITWLEIELVPVENAFIDSETVAFGNLDAFFALSDESDGRFEYTVSWIDCLAKGQSTGRGLFMRGNHATGENPLPKAGNTSLSMPVELPSFLMNRYSISAFNHAYYWKGRVSRSRSKVSLYPFFYPLDSIGNWNRMYGKGGMYQYQSAVPRAFQRDATHEMLKAIADEGQGSFLAVLKTFGDVASPGLLSFPRPGTTLALDFPNHGQSTLRLLARLDDIVHEAGGRLYPAKDGRMPAKMFQSGYPEWERFSDYVDPAFSSAFWRRVQAKD